MIFYFDSRKIRTRAVRVFMPVFLLALCACGGGDEPSGEEAEQEFLRIPSSEMTQSFPYEGGSASIVFSSSDAWTAEVSAGVEWMHVSPGQGEMGDNCTIELSVDKNEASDPRAAMVTIRSGSFSETVTVTQDAWLLVPGSDAPDDMPVEPW